MKRRSPRIVRFRLHPVAAAHEGQGCRPRTPLPLCAGCVNGERDRRAQMAASNCALCVILGFLVLTRFYFMPRAEPACAEASGAIEVDSSPRTRKARRHLPCV